MKKVIQLYLLIHFPQISIDSQAWIINKYLLIFTINYKTVMVYTYKISFKIYKLAKFVIANISFYESTVQTSIFYSSKDIQIILACKTIGHSLL